MPLFREDNFLVVHTGSQNTIFSFGLKDSLAAPQYKIPSVVFFDKSTNEYRSTNINGQLKEISPIKGSRVVDISALQALFKFILQTIVQKHPIITINQIPLLWIVPSISYSRAAIEQVTKFVFETLELTAFNVLDLSVSSSFGLGATSSSLVVNIGHESTQIMPVIGGAGIKYAAKRLEVGGKTIDDELKKLLPHLTDSQISSLKTSSIFEVLNSHADSFYSLADLSESKTASDDEFDVARIVAEGDEKKIFEEKENGALDELKANNELEKNSFVDASGETLYIGKERFQASAKLVAEVADGIYESLLRVPDLDKRQECYDNLVFVGSTCNIIGLKQAIVIKLCEHHLTKPANGKKGKTDLNGVNSAIAAYQQTDDAVEEPSENAGPSQVPSSIKMVKHPDYFPEWKKPKGKGGSWLDVYFLGGEIYSKQIFGANSNHGGDSFIDTEVYEERGPLAIWDVSL